MKGKINQSDMRYVQSKFEEFKKRETFASEREALSALGSSLEKLLSEDAEYGRLAFREYLQGIVSAFLTTTSRYAVTIPFRKERRLNG